MLFKTKKNEATGPAVLIVEDDPTFARSLASLLEKNGHATSMAENGQAALDILEARQKQNPGMIAAIVSDWKMPKLDGIELLKVVRDRDEFKAIPFVLMSGLVSHDELISALRLGADAVIAKPFREHAILEALAKARTSRGV